jgi:hypothetical protein
VVAFEAKRPASFVDRRGSDTKVGAVLDEPIAEVRCEPGVQCIAPLQDGVPIAVQSRGKVLPYLNAHLLEAGAGERPIRAIDQVCWC